MSSVLSTITSWFNNAPAPALTNTPQQGMKPIRPYTMAPANKEEHMRIISNRIKAKHKKNAENRAQGKIGGYRRSTRRNTRRSTRRNTRRSTRHKTHRKRHV